MTGKGEKDPAPTQAEHDPEDTPATEGALGNQGGTSQPGPPTDPNDERPEDLDFSKRGGASDEKNEDS